MTRVRLRKVRASRWKRGSACESNPRTRVFRDAYLKGKESEREEKTLFETSPVSPFSDTLSNKSFAFSGLTECSVVTFRRIFQKFTNPDEFNKEVCVVFNSIANMIQERTDNPQDCDFFCCLLSSLDPAEENATLVSSMVYLISLVVLKVSPALLTKCACMGLEKFNKILFTVAEQLDGRNIVCLCKCICAFFSHSNSTILSQLTFNFEETYTKVLTLVTHSCPKVSHGVAKHITKLLISENGVKFVPSTSRFVNIFLQTATSYQNMNAKFIIVFDMLNFLKKILHLFSERYLKDILNNLLKFSLVCSKNIKHEIFKTLSAFYSHLPSEEILSLEVNRKLLMAFEDMLPKTAVACNQSTLEILRTMAKCTNTINSLNAEYGCSSLLQFSRRVVPFSLSERLDLKRNVFNLIEDVAGHVLTEENLTMYYSNESYAKNIKDLCTLLKSCLNIEHVDLFDDLFRLLKRLFEAVGLFYPEYLRSFVFPFFNLYENPCVQKLKRVGDLLSLIINKIGPEFYLSCFDDQTILSVPWILSLMKDSMKNNVHLKFYTNKLQPLLHTNVISDDIRSIIEQLLPKFCLNAQDLDEISCFVDAAIYRLETYSGDSQMLFALMELQSNTKIQFTGLNFTKVAQVLWQVYLEMRSREGLEVHELNYLANMVLTFRHFAASLDGNPVQTIFSQIVQTLYACKLEMVPVLFDVMRAIVHKVDTLNCEQFFSSFIVAFNNSYLPKMNRPSTNMLQQTLAKKFLRLVVVIMMHHKLNCIFADGREYFLRVLKVLTSVPLDPPTKTALLNTLSKFVMEIPSAKEVISTFLPWVILCCGDAGQAKLKKAATDTISTFCESLGNDPNKYTCFVSIFEESLELSNDAVIASLCALNSFIYRYRMMLSQEMFVNLLGRVLFILKKQKNRSVVRECYNFIKIAIKCIEPDILHIESPKILMQLFLMEKINKHSCRDDVFIIISKFIRKLGLSFVLASTPKMAKIFVRNVSKRVKRKKKLDGKKKHIDPDLRLCEGNEPIDLTRGEIPIVKVNDIVQDEPKMTEDGKILIETGNDVQSNNLFNRRGPIQKQKRKGQEFGAEYRSKRAKGDIKVKGKPAPYAYIPLTDKRRCGKAQKTTSPFQGLVGKKAKRN